MKVKMRVVFDHELDGIFEIEENEIKRCLQSEFFKLQEDNCIYIINTKNIKYIFYKKENEKWI